MVDILKMGEKLDMIIDLDDGGTVSALPAPDPDQPTGRWIDVVLQRHNDDRLILIGALIRAKDRVRYYFRPLYAVDNTLTAEVLHCIAEIIVRIEKEESRRRHPSYRPTP